jgi:hypothetical protein
LAEIRNKLAQGLMRKINGKNHRRKRESIHSKTRELFQGKRTLQKVMQKTCEKGDAIIASNLIEVLCQ